MDLLHSSEYAVPGLAENRCLSRHAQGARLLQVGEQSVALGAKFRAEVILDIQVHPQFDLALLWQISYVWPVLFAVPLQAFAAIDCCLQID